MRTVGTAMRVARRSQRTRRIEREHNILSTERAAFVGGVECDRGAAWLIEERRASVGDSRINS
eukprot:574078-Pleurochrysis_carterae.AAC.2